MSKLEGLRFSPVPAIAASDEAVIKVGVLKNDVIRITLNAAAYEKLGKPVAFAVEAAAGEAGNFLKLIPAEQGRGWAVTARTPPSGGRGARRRVSEGRLSAIHSR